MPYEMSFEVLDGEFGAHHWSESYGDALAQAALAVEATEWRWRHFEWGSVLEIDFPSEAAWEQFRANPAVWAALDAVPDRVNGLLIYRGHGGTAGPREPLRPRPMSGAGAAALEFPGEWKFEAAQAAPEVLVVAGATSPAGPP